MTERNLRYPCLAIWGHRKYRISLMRYIGLPDGHIRLPISTTSLGSGYGKRQGHSEIEPDPEMYEGPVGVQ